VDYASHVKNAVHPTDRLRGIIFRDSARVGNLSIIIIIIILYIYRIAVCVNHVALVIIIIIIF